MDDHLQDETILSPQEQLGPQERRAFSKQFCTKRPLLSSHLHLVRKADMDIFKACREDAEECRHIRLTGLVDPALHSKELGRVHTLPASQDRPRQKDRKSEVGLGGGALECDGFGTNVPSWLKAAPSRIVLAMVCSGPFWVPHVPCWHKCLAKSVKNSAVGSSFESAWSQHSAWRRCDPTQANLYSTEFFRCFNCSLA